MWRLLQDAQSLSLWNTKYSGYPKKGVAPLFGYDRDGRAPLFRNSTGVMPVCFLNSELKVDFELKPEASAMDSTERSGCSIRRNIISIPR